MASLSRFGLVLALLHAISHSEAWVDILRVQTNFAPTPQISLQEPPVGYAEIQGQLVALEKTIATQYKSLEEMLKKVLEQRSTNGDNVRLRRDVAEAINQGRFGFVEEKMLELDNPAAVADIVRDISSKSDRQFELIVNLTNNVSDTSLQSQILTTLYNKATQSEPTSTQNLIALAKVLSAKGASHLFEGLVDQISRKVTLRLVDLMTSEGSYQNNAEVRDLAASIADWRNVSEKVMTDLVSRVFTTVDSKQILEAVSSHTDTWQALVGVDTLIEALNSADSFEGDIVLDIATHLNEIMTRDVLHSTVQDYARRLKERIPDCIGKLTSLTQFCIWNEHTGSFLVSSRFYYDNPLVHVVTEPRWENGSTPTGATWQHHRNDEWLFFESIDYPNEILHATDISFHDFHRALSLVQTGDLDDKNKWVIESAGDSCFLKNYWNNEYLYASDAEFEEGTKLVGTKVKRNDLEDDYPEFAWQIISC